MLNPKDVVQYEGDSIKRGLGVASELLLHGNVVPKEEEKQKQENKEDGKQQ